MRKRKLRRRGRPPWLQFLMPIFQAISGAVTGAAGAVGGALGIGGAGAGAGAAAGAGAGAGASVGLGAGTVLPASLSVPASTMAAATAPAAAGGAAGGALGAAGGAAGGALGATVPTAFSPAAATAPSSGGGVLGASGAAAGGPASMTPFSPTGISSSVGMGPGTTLPATNYPSVATMAKATTPNVPMGSNIAYSTQPPAPSLMQRIGDFRSNPRVQKTEEYAGKWQKQKSLQDRMEGFRDQPQGAQPPPLMQLAGGPDFPYIAPGRQWTPKNVPPAWNWYLLGRKVLG